MKPVIFMIAATLFGTAGVFFISPFCGVFAYYLFAVLRPQAIWYWVLPPGVNWSLYVALAAIAGALAVLGGGLSADPARGPAGRQGPDPRRPRRRFSGAHVAMLAFGCWILITCLTARNLDVAGLWFVEYLKIFVMYAVGAYLIRTVRQVWALFLMIAVVLAYISYEVNYLYFFYHYMAIYRDGYGGLDNNGAGLTLAMGMPVCWFAYEGTRRWWRWGYLLGIPVIVHAVLMTYSRGAMLSLIVACPWIWWRSRQKVRLSVALAAFVLMAIPVMAGPEISARFLTLEQNETDQTANLRRNSWAAGWRIALDNPIFGVGVRNSPLFSLQYGADMEGRAIHSQYIQILADNGFVGLALYLLLLATAAVSMHRARRFAATGGHPDAPVIAAIASGVECSLVVFCFGAAFLSLEVFELPFLLLLLAAQLPVVSGALEAPPRAAPPAPRGGPALLRAGASAARAVS